MYLLNVSLIVTTIRTRVSNHILKVYIDFMKCELYIRDKYEIDWSKHNPRFSFNLAKHSVSVIARSK